MALKTLRRWCTSRAAIVALVILLGVSLAITAAGATEAFEEHSAGTAVTNLRLAVLSVLEIDEQQAITPAAAERLNSDIATLRGDLSDALHAFDTNDHPVVRAEIDRVIEHASAMSTGQMMDMMSHNVDAHRELEMMLRSASESATADAHKSERTTRIATLSSILILLVLGTSVFAARARKTRKSAMSDAFHAAALRLGTLLDESSDATAILIEDGTFSYRSARFEQLFAPHDVSDVATLSGLVTESTNQPLEQILLTSGAEGATFAVTTTEIGTVVQTREFAVKVTDLRTDPLVEGHLLSLRETTDDNQARRRLEALAGTDQLTGLPNRRALMTDLGAPNCQTAGLLMLDLDNFKETNDTHGHQAGDQLLNAVAGRFEGCCEKGQTLYRLGGDEFAVSVEHGGAPELNALGERLVRILDEPIALSAGFEEARVSVGIALWKPSDRPTGLLQRADIALYAAKSRGGKQVEILGPELEADSLRQRSISHLLHTADLDEEFSLVFQPVVESHSGRVAFVEALIRWHNPKVGDVYPDEFISMAESSGRIVEIGLWVIRNALRELVGWRQAGLDPSIGMSVNVSPRQLEEVGFVDQSLELLQSFDIAHSDLIMEVTESALVEPGHDIVRRLTQLQASGCRIACDDFGSGYSNLGQLMTLPLDLVKVDRLLLLHLSEMRAKAGGDNQASCDVMGAIATIAGAMDATIVAEGVETKEQQTSLQASNIDYLQGYLFSKPVSGDKLLDVLAENKLVFAAATKPGTAAEETIKR